MNIRERYIETLTFGTPDKIPFDPGWPRESTIAAWHQQGLPEGANWLEYLVGVLHIDYDWTRTPMIDIGVDFRLMPQFEEKVLEHKDGHYIVQDWKGNICEISDEYDVTYLRYGKDFVTRRWIKCPVENREDWEQMKLSYDTDTPDRFPANFNEQYRKAVDRDYLSIVGISGPFWQMREWCGFEGLCMMMLEQPELVAEMADFWMNFVSDMLKRILDNVVFDLLYISEDMAYKAKAMISPEMTREFCKPSWDCWTSQIRAAGVPIVDMDSDGYVGELIPIWIESGLKVCDPIEVAAHNDIVQYRRQFGRKMAYRGGVDKRAISTGGNIIKNELKRIEPVIKDGGYIPSCDHAVPSDVSWPDFVEYSRLLAQITGWL